MKEQETKRISKFLSLVLRHQPETIGIKLDEQGWADVDELISRCNQKGVRFSREELDEVVATNDKKRFAFNEDGSRIRANQGHSIEVDLSLSPIMPPEYLYHGTASRFYESIMKEGIKKMNRRHVHLSLDMQTATKVGSRHGKVVVLTIQSGKMERDGHLFYRSENGVWLTDFVDPKYILFSCETNSGKKEG